MNTGPQLGRRELLAGAAAATLVRGVMPQPVSYLVILADQLTWWMCDPAQRGSLALPNIDRLRAEGTVFERCYTTSPFCRTARTCLRTGRFPHTNESGLVLQQPADTVERRMREDGRATRYFGKWHLSPNPDLLTEFVRPADRLNWDLFVGHELSHNKQIAYVQDDPAPISTAPWDPAVMTDFAVRSMREDAARGQPFFAHVNYLPPHQPYTAYPAKLGIYTVSNAVLRPNSGTNPIQASVLLANYMNLVHGLDIEIGRLLDELDTLGTEVVVVFTSDHGDMLFSQGLKFKRVPYEESMRVPLIVRGPGWGPGRVRYPVGLVDLAQTLAGLGQGIHLGDSRDSVYFGLPPTLAPDRNWSGGAWRGLVTDDEWKLALGSSGARLLFNLEEDPYEQSDLAGQGLDREAELETRMREWAQATQDPFFG